MADRLIGAFIAPRGAPARVMIAARVIDGANVIAEYVIGYVDDEESAEAFVALIRAEVDDASALHLVNGRAA